MSSIPSVSSSKIICSYWLLFLFLIFSFSALNSAFIFLSRVLPSSCLALMNIAAFFLISSCDYFSISMLLLCSFSRDSTTM